MFRLSLLSLFLVAANGNLFIEKELKRQLQDFDLDAFQFNFAGVNINAEIAQAACPDAWQATVSCVISTCPEFLDVCPEFEIPAENQGTIPPEAAPEDPPADAGDMGEEMMEDGMETMGNMTMMNDTKPETMPEMPD